MQVYAQVGFCSGLALEVVQSPSDEVVVNA